MLYGVERLFEYEKSSNVQFLKEISERTISLKFIYFGRDVKLNLSFVQNGRIKNASQRLAYFYLFFSFYSNSTDLAHLIKSSL